MKVKNPERAYWEVKCWWVAGPYENLWEAGVQYPYEVGDTWASVLTQAIQDRDMPSGQLRDVSIRLIERN